MPRSARKPEQVERIREAILDAAMRVFSRSGYHDVSMKDVAREAGYTAPSLYNYFASKEAIYAGLVTRVCDEFFAVFDEPIPHGLTFEQRLELLVGRKLDLARRHHESFALFMKLQAAVASDEAFTRRRLEIFSEYVARLVTWLGEAGAPRKFDPEVLGFALWGLLHAFQVRGVLRQRPAEKDLARTICTFFMRGAEGGVR